MNSREIPEDCKEFIHFRFLLLEKKKHLTRTGCKKGIQILEPIRKILREFLLNQAAISAIVLTIALKLPVHTMRCNLYHTIPFYYYVETKKMVHESVNLKGVVYN